MGRSIGWFDAFRDNGGPTWYGDNRTPVVVDTGTFAIIAVFSIFLLAFLIIMPGIRRQRLSSFVSVVLTLLVGAILLVCIHHPCWHEGEVRIYSTYRAFTADRMDAILGVRVGLKYVNITLSSVPPPLSAGGDVEALRRRQLHDVYRDLNFNERFRFTEVKSMERELHRGLHKGLPYPILKVIEYLSVDRGGFVWGRQYRLAGYYACILLWLAFACWSLQVLMLCLVPHYFARTVMAVGVCTWLADIIYFAACPKQLRIRFPGADDQMSVLDFHLGWCFYLTVAAGAACVLFGLLVSLLEAKSLYKLTTFLQADFDEATSSPARVDRDSDRRQQQRRPGGVDGELDDLDDLNGERTEIEFLPLAVIATEETTSGALARRKSTPQLTKSVEPV